MFIRFPISFHCFSAAFSKHLEWSLRSNGSTMEKSELEDFVQHKVYDSFDRITALG
jgi:hypothetical protein